MFNLTPVAEAADPARPAPLALQRPAIIVQCLRHKWPRIRRSNDVCGPLRRFICVAPAKRPATERQFNLLTLTAAQRAVRLPGRRRRPIGMPRCSRWASFSSCAMQSAIQVVQPTALRPTKSFDSHSQGDAPIDIAIGCVNRRHILAAVIRPEWSVAGLQAVAGT